MVPLDSVLVFNSTRWNTIIRPRNAEVMGSFDLQDYTILEFARLLDTVCTSAPRYRLDGTMCYWSTSTIVSISNSFFHGKGKMPSSCAGKYAGIRRHTEDPVEIAGITKKYSDVWEANPEPTGPILKELEETWEDLRSEQNK